jgi:hypothetical protein
MHPRQVLARKALVERHRTNRLIAFGAIQEYAGFDRPYWLDC